LKVEVLSGKGCIGGNFVRVEDGDRVLIFDQGVRFDVLGRYYSGYIAPMGLHELREIGAVPRAEWYAGASAIYVSHMHLDHLGLLANIPSKVDVFLPNLSLYEAMEEKWWGSPTWLSMVPHKYYVRLEEARPLEADRNGVMALPVSHSAFPAYAFLYFGSDETLLYTGDFRVEGFCLRELWKNMPHMLEYLRENRDIRVDRLIVEGTNIGSFRPPVSPSEEEAMLNRILAGHSLAVATIHPLDAEYALFLSEKAAKRGRPLYIASSEAARLLDGLGGKPAEAAVLASHVKMPTRFDVKEADDVEGNALIITSYREVLTVLRELGDALPPTPQ